MKPLDPIDHARALALGVDVPEEPPAVRLPLTHVGIAGKTIWITLPTGQTPFAADITVDLDADRRGIHMSRIEQAIAELVAQPHADPTEYARDLALRVLAAQGSETCEVAIRGELPIWRNGPVSGRSSLDTAKVESIARASVAGGRTTLSSTVAAATHHITACPCTQAYQAALFGPQERDLPLPTHSQRSRTMLSIQTEAAPPSHADLLRVLEGVLHITHDLLKRGDEADLVLRSHRRPQFAEDVVRETVRAALHALSPTLPPSALLRVETVSFESIHGRDVVCRFEASLGQLGRTLAVPKNGF